MADKVASVLARLKNESKTKQISFQQILNLFCQEEFMRRISNSSYKENLILKGGYLLYSISGFTTRPTIDADYLLKNHSNDFETIKIMIEDIISQSSSYDFIEYSIRNLEAINETREYFGIRVNLIGNIGKTRTQFSVDFGVGDVIFPSFVEREITVILDDFEKPRIKTYSLESTIAEKLDAIIKLMEANSRMKDFYDIYYLAITFDFEGEQLQKAIFNTLTNRETKYESDSIKSIRRLSNNTLINQRWTNFCNKILNHNLDLSDVVEIIIGLTSAPFQAMVEKDIFLKKWSHKDRKYL